MLQVPFTYISSVVAVSSLFLFVVRSVKSVFFHALSKYPGPPLAAATTLYRAYYDIVKDGGWLEHLFSLHETYGILYNPKAYHDIYGIGTRFIKEKEMYSCFATDKSVFAMHDHKLAMQLRTAIGPFFSRKAILDLENVIQSKVYFAFRSLSLEVITTYCFARSSHAMDAPNFQHPILSAIDNTLPMIWIFKHFPLVQKVLLSVPECFASVLKPSTTGIIEQKRMIKEQIDQILEDPSTLSRGGHETIYHYFLNPKNKEEFSMRLETDPKDNSLPNPTGELEGRRDSTTLSKNYLLDEGLYMRFAGSDTVGTVCTAALYHILNNPLVHQTLLKEMMEIWPDKGILIGYEKLEKLPYFTAVIKEALRMGHGVVSPLPRIVGPSDAEVLGITIPAGTVVSMGAPILHYNPEIFPNPMSFIPERWIGEENQSLDKYLVSFSKGPRSCLGINLAWCELYLTIANVVRKLDLKPDNSTYVPCSLCYR
ncbi:hypothetical protein AGABI1DRAFT_69832 [Agaricus bisporus var. burnettii JB137-S8]|uniref:Cytochrome P450 n=1 Tax=Agaricus bisporus var. burnettii (strain JB137-S8 / ATCC MYA-4627 / FGSC 10392) TaxID=597362 RepID=K5XEE2_AGABU|nr:uncharacterized protein AGABI1DRAFT_69832 [Agaricus bisporus var. burnettii JB137-S8]EKM81552.1 hypothetical protein AGABI1DRAFT_69832 [Agaricus bisporus var. burnettii JB137-S8]